ncbi:MAG: hypothetical protein AWU57_63 [Marinobacter sp. T13-3]|nr:MAG: hypothetical protein AWU57_63 [Marinobacter sp. T13-3]
MTTPAALDPHYESAWAEKAREGVKTSFSVMGEAGSLLLCSTLVTSLGVLMAKEGHRASQVDSIAQSFGQMTAVGGVGVAAVGLIAGVSALAYSYRASKWSAAKSAPDHPPLYDASVERIEDNLQSLATAPGALAQLEHLMSSNPNLEASLNHIADSASPDSAIAQCAETYYSSQQAQPSSVSHSDGMHDQGNLYPSLRSHLDDDSPSAPRLD